MAADLKRSIGRVLIMAHPLEIGFQEGLIDLLGRQGIHKPRITKVVEETIYRVTHPTHVFFWRSPVPAPPPEERASGIPRRSDSDRKEDPGSPIRSRTGSEKIPAQDFRDAEDDMSVGNLPEHVGTEPFPEFHH